jgi:phage portal protein BeeE
LEDDVSLFFKKSSSDQSNGQILAEFPSLSTPWRYDGRSIVADPGLPLTDYAQSAYSIWQSQPSVRKVVDFIASNIASIPMKVYRRNGDTDRERVTDGPLAELIREPQKHLTQYRFWHTLLCDFLVYDRFMAQLVPSADSRAGVVLQHWPAQSWRFTHTGTSLVDGVDLYVGDGKPKHISLDGLFFDRGYGSGNGTPPIETLRHILDEYTESVKYRSAIHKKGARFPAVVTQAVVPDVEPLDSAARQRLEAEMSNWSDGGGSEGKMPVLPIGADVKKVDIFSPKDMQEVEGRTLTDIEVASAYHVPPEMIGARQGNYANMEAFRQLLYRDSLGSTIVQFEQAFNLHVTPLVNGGDESLYVEFDLDVKLRGSFEERAAIMSQAIGGPWLRLNEGRAKENLPAIEGGDEIITPLNVVRGGGPQASPADATPEVAKAYDLLRSKGLDPKQAMEVLWATGQLEASA